MAESTSAEGMKEEVERRRKKRRRTLAPANAGGGGEDEMELVEVNEAEEELAALRQRGGETERDGDVADERLEEAELASLNQEQILDYHRKNLELVEKSKVTAKNAFTFNIAATIKHMKEYTRGEDAFEVYGKGVEASVKIFSYRVDNVYQNANKVMGCLRGGPEEGDGAAGGDDQRRKEKRRRNPGGATIEAEAEKLNLEGLRWQTLLQDAAVNEEGSFEDDALFKQVVSKYDEGGTLGLLLNNVSPESDALPNPRLHCLALPTPSAAPRLPTDAFNPGDLHFCEETRPAPVATELASFRFTGWNPREEAKRRRTDWEDDKDVLNTSQTLLDNSSQAPDNVAIQEALIAETTQHAAQLRLPTPDFLEDAEGFNMDDADADDVAERPASSRSHRSTSILSTATANLVTGLNPTDYSYFDADRLAAEKRRRHWRPVEDRKRQGSAQPTTAATRRREKKQAEPIPLVAFEHELPFPQRLNEANAKGSETIAVSAAAWANRVAAGREQLPDPRLAYDARAFASFALRSSQTYSQFRDAMAELLARLEQGEDDEDNDARDFENQALMDGAEDGDGNGPTLPTMFGDSAMNDQTTLMLGMGRGGGDGDEAFQPALPPLAELNEEDEDQQDHSARTRLEAGLSPVRELAAAETAETAGAAMAGIGMGTTGLGSAMEASSELAEDGLIACPVTIKVPKVGFVKSACRINVGRYKSAMWETLKTEAGRRSSLGEMVESEASNPGNDPRLAADPERAEAELSGEASFVSLYRKIPPRAILPEKTVHPSTALTVFLHLANQKELRLKRPDGRSLATPADIARYGWGNMDDFIITKAKPVDKKKKK